MQNQLYAFIIFILNGLLTGLIFDIFRISRKVFKTPDLITYIEDVLFWVISGLIVMYSIFKFNNGEIRLFVFIGICIGLVIYLLVFSKLFIKFSVYIINFLKKVIQIIIIKPIQFILKLFNKILIKPTILICINIKKLFKKRKNKRQKLLFINRIFKNKKDFA